VGEPESVGSEVRHPGAGEVAEEVVCLRGEAHQTLSGSDVFVESVQGLAGRGELLHALGDERPEQREVSAEEVRCGIRSGDEYQQAARHGG